MAKRTLAEIDADIASVKAELENVHGTETEVYARIVGYYRAVRNWNKGKRDEFNIRKTFEVKGDNLPEKEPEPAVKVVARATEKAVPSQTSLFDEEKSLSNEESFRYEFFMRQTCPNCPPVKKYMENVSLDGEKIDIDTDSGIKKAASRGVFAVPTVIFYDADGNESGRAHNVEELDAVLNPVAVAV